jgi:5-methylcytosine-specific restriction endonuclease McrA
MPSAEYTEAQREYREVYLRSDHWQEVRKAALERAGRRCQVCNGDKQLDVHHRTYERKGREEPSDVTVLCRKCHETFHGNGKISPHAPGEEAHGRTQTTTRGSTGSRGPS